MIPIRHLSNRNLICGLERQKLASDEVMWARLRLKCDTTRAETRCRFSEKTDESIQIGWRHHFSQLLAAEVCASAVVMLDTPCSEVV